MIRSSIFFRAAFYILDCGEQERPHLLQRQAGPAGQAPDGDRGRRAAEEHALGRRHRPGYGFQLIRNAKERPGWDAPCLFFKGNKIA